MKWFTGQLNIKSFSKAIDEKCINQVSPANLPPYDFPVLNKTLSK